MKRTLSGQVIKRVTRSGTLNMKSRDMSQKDFCKPLPNVCSGHKDWVCKSPTSCPVPSSAIFPVLPLLLGEGAPLCVNNSYQKRLLSLS